MVPDGTRWFTMVQDGAEICRVVTYGAGWCHMVHDGEEWHNMVLDSARYCEMVPLGAQWRIMVSYDAVRCTGGVEEDCMGGGKGREWQWRRDGRRREGDKGGEGRREGRM